MILAPLQKMPKNVGDLGKLIVAKGFKKSPKVQKIANSGHTGFQQTHKLIPLKSSQSSNQGRTSGHALFLLAYTVRLA